jgi:hypothetical protein
MWARHAKFKHDRLPIERWPYHRFLHFTADYDYLNRSTERDPKHLTASTGRSRSWSVSISGADLSISAGVTVGLHPTSIPVEVTSSGVALQACPATVDVGDDWPFGQFSSCLHQAPTASSLPATDGTFHVGFEIRGITSAASDTTVTINYHATDSYFEVVPPVTPSPTEMTLTIVPNSLTVGVSIFPVGAADNLPAPGFEAAGTQNGQSLRPSVHVTSSRSRGPAFMELRRTSHSQ